MKYIKKFESPLFTNDKLPFIKYNEGEYVSLGDGIIARIIKISKFKDNNKYQLYVEILDKERNVFWNKHWINEDDIERYLNQEEKEVVKLATNIKKYNL